jgi:hypothetical protein
MTHILVFLFIFSLLNCIRNGFLFYKRLVSNIPRPFKMGLGELVVLGVSISFTITGLFCGFTL